MAIKPARVSVELHYNCPQCNEEYTITIEESKIPGFSIKCCSESYLVQPVDKVNIKLTFDKLCSPNTEKDIIKSAFRVLSDYQYTKKEVKDFVRNKYYACHQQLVRDFLSAK
jgi:hypothetical protein